MVKQMVEELSKILKIEVFLKEHGRREKWLRVL